MSDKEKILQRIEETLARVDIRQEALCNEVAALRDRLDGASTTERDTGGGAAQQDVIRFLDQFRAGEALGEASLGAWIAVCEDPCLRGGLRTVQQREGFHARLLAERIKELGGTPSHEIPEDVYQKLMDDAATTDKSDAEKLRDFVAQFPDPDATLRPITDLADRLTDDPETAGLLRTIVQDERSTLDFLCQVCTQLNS